MKQLLKNAFYENRRVRDHVGAPDIDVRTILYWVVEKFVVFQNCAGV
jgi:hypothetical protein